MTTPADGATERWLTRLDPLRFGRLLLGRRARLAVAWAAALFATGLASVLAWYSCRDDTRADGNWGHVNIDFSGQWVLAALFASGEGGNLYDRPTIKTLLERSYPVESEPPGQKKHDPAQILDWLRGDRETALCGPLYPPVHGMLYAPLGLLSPQHAYRVVQLINLVLTIFSAWLVERLTRGHVWMPVALVVLFLYPGHAGSFHLGQNPVLSMTILLFGWELLRNGRPCLAGVAWGFLAYKPVWAAAFLLAALLTRRWRFAAAMAATGAALVLATLPFTGLRPWFDWFKIGRIASEEYGEMRNWVFLSRDLIGIPRRWLLTFDEDWVIGRPYGSLPTVLGVLLWVSVPLATAVLAWFKRREPAPLDGPGAAFVLLGAFFSCYHFMYYDIMLTVLPLALLFVRPRWYLERMWARPWWPPLPLIVLLVLLVAPPVARYFDPTSLYPPYDTFALLALWAWCGWQWVRAEDMSRNRQLAAEAALRSLTLASPKEVN
jgi:hypothetical protein